ncbi:MAG: hypothetical protein Q9201_007780 [Fulgogasparrea decipioides]
MADSWENLPAAHNYTFTTERLLLRPPRLDDIEGIFAMRSDPQIFYWKDPDSEKAQSQAWIQARLESNCYLSFLVEELPDARDDHGKTTDKSPVIGVMGGTHLPEIGYIFRPSVWGRGYATEALKGFIKFYWETFPQGHPSIPLADNRGYLEAVTGTADEAPQASASIAVLKKCGFQYWGEQKAEEVEKPGQTVMLPVWRCWGPNHTEL